MRFLARLAVNAALLAAAAAVLAAAGHIAAAGLYSPVHLSGWFLLVLIVLLALFGLRHRILPFAGPSGTVLLQAHIYMGALAIVGFLFHSGWPEGLLETTLWTLFVLVAASGVIGLALSRAIPARMGAIGDHGDAHIPQLRARLALRAEELVASSLARGDRQSLVALYAYRLRPFLEKPRNFLHHATLSDAPLRRLQHDVAGVKQLLDDEGRELADQLRSLAEEKDTLDYQRAMVLIMRAWLFIHVPATGALLLLCLVHLASVYGYSIGDR